MSKKKILAGLAFCTATVYAVITLYRAIDHALRLSSPEFSFWWYARQDVWDYCLATFALIIVMLSLVFIKKGEGQSTMAKDMWLGIITGGSASFIYPFVMIGIGLFTGSATDGTYWWGMWFLPTFFSAIPLTIMGVLICTIIGWLQRRKL